MVLPNMWTDTMTFFNQFISWDIVKGFFQATIAIGIAGYAIGKISQALSH